VVLSLTGIAVSYFLTPFCHTLTHLLITVALLGFCCASYDTAQLVWIMEMWQSKSGPFVQAQHFFVALGTNVPALLMTYFLEKKKETEVDEEPEEKEMSYTTPFIILGSMASLNLAFELFLVTCFPYTPPERENNDLELALKEIEEKEGNKINWHKIKLIALSALFIGFYIGMELCSMQFIPTLAQIGAGMGESEGALVLTGLTASYAAGRVLGIFVSIKVSSYFILWTNLALIVIANGILVLWGHSDPFWLWVTSITLGFGLSTIFASFFSFMEKHMVFTDMVGSVLLVTGSCVSIVYPAIIGRWVEVEDRILAYSNFTSCFIMIISFTTINIIVGRK
jgi:FHS family Na+ dependent glucose MFS transporter 1